MAQFCGFSVVKAKTVPFSPKSLNLRHLKPLSPRRIALVQREHMAFRRVSIFPQCGEEGKYHLTDVELYTVPEFLRCFSISRTGFYREVKAGRIRLLKLGTASRVSRKDAEAWMQSLPEKEGMAA